MNAQADYVERLKRRVVRQEALHGKPRKASDSQLARAEARSSSALMEIAVHRYRLHNDIDRLSSNWGTITVEFKRVRFLLSTVRAEIWTVTGQLTEQERLEEKVEQRATEV